MMGRLLTLAILVSVVALTLAAQEQPKPAPMPPGARLTAAKTAFVKNGGGSEIPYNVISTAFEGWGRFVPVESPDKADIIVEVTAPEENNGISFSSTTTRSAPIRGHNESSVTTTKSLSVTQIKMVVYDAMSKMPLWSGSEQPKGAMKQKAREDNIVQAAQRLFAKFHERMEPAPTQ